MRNYCNDIKKVHVTVETILWCEKAPIGIWYITKAKAGKFKPVKIETRISGNSDNYSKSSIIGTSIIGILAIPG